MRFLEFKNAVELHFYEMIEGEDVLFETNADKHELYNTYLNSFPAGTNNIFIKRREYDCSSCRNFIMRIGHVVKIKNGVVYSIWDLDIDDPKFGPVAKELSKYVKSKSIRGRFLFDSNNVGSAGNYAELENGKITRFNHFHVELPYRFVRKNKRGNTDSISSEVSFFGSVRNVFKRSLDEISQEAVEIVLEMISENILYKGEEWKSQIEEFLNYKKLYDKIGADDESKELFAWEQSAHAGPIVGKIRNHSIGTLLTNLSEGMNLERAVKQYEDITAPSNYKRSKAIYTKRMLEEAKSKIESLGYMQSLGRRFATLNDISVNNILFSNADVRKKMGSNDSLASVFDEMEQEASVNPNKFSRAEEISINDFIDNILPSAKDVELLHESRLSTNMVSLIAPKDINAPSMFKWNNPFSWAYAGNITDSDIRENVKNAGGSVTGVLRFSIQWNDGNKHDPNDLDAHCILPSGFRIYFQNSYDPDSRGNLDIDIQRPIPRIPAVENITWESKKYMKKGNYRFRVHQYAYRGGRNGFRAEIEFDGQIYKFDYNKPLKNKEFVEVATVHFDGENFSIKEVLPSDMSVRTIWNIKTNQFIPVSTIMYSPNYWDQQNGIGHKHYFFMLKDCINEESPNGFYNEFLKNELLIEHKKVFEALGSKMHVENTDDQLSGIGFSSTKRNNVIVKVKSSDDNQKVYNIKF